MACITSSVRSIVFEGGVVEEISEITFTGSTFGGSGGAGTMLWNSSSKVWVDMLPHVSVHPWYAIGVVCSHRDPAETMLLDEALQQLVQRHLDAKLFLESFAFLRQKFDV